MLGGITYTVLAGMPLLPMPKPLMDALQKIEVETSTEMASVFRLRFGLSQNKFGDWDLIMPQYEETLFRPLTPVQIRVKVGVAIPMAIINGYITSQRVLYDEVGLIPMVHRPQLTVMNKRVNGFQPTPFGGRDFRGVSLD